MARFALLLHDSFPPEGDFSPEEMQSVIAEYTAWAASLGDKHTGGNKLKDEGGRILQMADGTMQVTDGPYAEAKELIGGLIMMEADDYASAVELCRTCPHLKYGLRIEVREIDLMDECAP